MAQQEFKYLFTPLKLGTVTVPNRIFMSGAGVRISPEAYIDYYAARAKGGAGLIIASGPVPFPPNTVIPPATYQMYIQSRLPHFKKLAEAIHQYDTRTFLQFNHPGSLIKGRGTGGGAVPGPSPVWRRNLFIPGGQEIAHEMDEDEIKEAVKGYAVAASVAREAGFDGVEIAAMVGLLLAQFISPAYNIRTDEYGGSLENRLRIILEIIDAVREAVGPDFTVGMRFTADDFIDHVWWTKHSGLNLDDGKEIAERLEATGKLDYLFPCGGGYGPIHVPPMYYPLGPFVYLSAKIKEVVDLPVFVTGRINDPVQAEKILANNQADMLCFLRGLIADPELPNKAREGRLEEIRKCLGCNEGCVGTIATYTGRPALLCINTEAGNEKANAIVPAETKKSVMVIGGGVAGLETARVAALRGHKVSLCEKNDVLAKELDIAAKVPGREDFVEAKRYYTYQMKLLNVDVHLGVTVTPEMVLKENPDAVVVATGAKPFIPEIPGANNHNVVEMRQVLLEEIEVGQNVLVVDYENHLYGLDTADFLAEKGKKVELINESIYAGGGVDYHTIWVTYSRVLSKGVILTPLTGVKEIRDKTVVVYNVLTNAERQIEGIDTLVVCTDGRADDSLYRSLKGKVKELHLVGQALSPRRMLDSTHDGARVGRKL